MDTDTVVAKQKTPTLLGRLLFLAALVDLSAYAYMDAQFGSAQTHPYQPAVLIAGLLLIALGNASRREITIEYPKSRLPYKNRVYAINTAGFLIIIAGVAGIGISVTLGATSGHTPKLLMISGLAAVWLGLFIGVCAAAAFSADVKRYGRRYVGSAAAAPEPRS
jgi:hypothetical protein